MSDDQKDSRKDAISGRFVTGGSPKEEQETQTEQEPQEKQTDKTNKTDNTGQEGQGDKAQKADRPSTKDKTALTMYLTPEQVNALDLRFQEINLEYQREHGARLQKNADFYPAVLEAAFTDQTVRDVLEIEE